MLSVVVVVIIFVLIIIVVFGKNKDYSLDNQLNLKSTRTNTNEYMKSSLAVMLALF